TAPNARSGKNVRDMPPLGGAHRRDREAIAALEDDHVSKRWIGAHRVEAEQSRLPEKPHVDVHPARALTLGLLVEILALAIELRGVGIGRRRDLRDTRD